MQIIPSHEVLERLNSMIRFVVSDLKTQATDEETFLYKMFGDSALFTKKYFDQLKKTLIGNIPHRSLEAKLGWDIDPQNLVGLRVYTENEGYGKENFIGHGEGRYGTLVNADTYQNITMQNYDTQCGVLVYSSNVLECELLYEFVKLGLMCLRHVFDASYGLKNMKIGGNTVYKDNATPYCKMISLSFDYDLTVPSTIKRQLLVGIQTNLILDEKK